MPIQRCTVIDLDIGLKGNVPKLIFTEGLKGNKLGRGIPSGAILPNVPNFVAIRKQRKI